MYKLINFYKFKELENLDILKKEIHTYLYKNNIKGTVLIADEGINVNLCGNENIIDQSIGFLKQIINIKSIHINQSKVQEESFKRLKVKIKKEIIKIGFNVNKNLINKNIRLKPKDWHKLLEENVTLLDVRNKFEHALGTFENAIGLDLLNFNDFESSLEQLNHLSKKNKVAIFCTGGIRCEKAAVLLDRFGFNQVIQLDGGILNYMNENLPNSKWKGKCFVFDDRITID
ncbi:MAG: rhodanese-like domain-containing protein [Pseudomonadota bacterium]|nr:rhodanese-like domain-containing protein [Pseudomonadota bacterium]